MYTNEAEKKERRKIVISSSAIMAVILVLVVAIIVVATTKGQENSVSNDGSAFTLSENADKPAEETENKSSEKAESKPTSTNAATSSNATTDKIAETGPEDLLPLALAMGGMTTVATTLLFSKRA